MPGQQPPKPTEADADSPDSQSSESGCLGIYASRLRLLILILGGVWPAGDSDLRSGLGVLKSDFYNLDQGNLGS